MSPEMREDLSDQWDALTGVLDFQRGSWFEWRSASPGDLPRWHEIDERRARAVMRDLGIDANADQRLNREVESLRPLTVVDMFRHRDAETHRRPHGTTKEQQEKDERAEDSWARLMEDAQVRLGL